MATKEIDRPEILVSSPSVGNVRIRYILPALSSIKIDIVDMNGRIVKTLYHGMTQAISGWLEWDGEDNNHRKVSNGIYYARLETDDISIAKKFVLVK